MTIGIYALYWAEQDLIYIGKSLTLDKRKYEHLRLLRNNEHTRKLQDAYNNFGIPVFYILQLCSPIELDTAEVSWITEFDALSGLNTLPGGQNVGKDTTHSSSKYTKEEILNLCHILCDYTVSQRDASKLTGISEAVISTILNGSKHTWIPKEITDKLDSIRQLRYKYNISDSKNKDYWIQSPAGVLYKVINISEFAKQNNLLGTKLNEVLKSKRKHHLGWKLPDKT
jgi:group I intron endonuclease